METYDLTLLDGDELLELRELQRKMLHLGGSIEAFDKLTVPELSTLLRLYYKMAGKPDPHPEQPWCPSWHLNPSVTQEAGGAEYDPETAVQAAPAETAPAEPFEALKQAPAKTVPVESLVPPADTPAPAKPEDKPHKLPADHINTALHALDGLMRFGT